MESYLQWKVWYPLICSVYFTSVTIDNFDYASPTAESLFERIVLRSWHCEMEASQRNVRSDMVYPIKGDFFNEATTDKNGVYLNSRSNKKQYFTDSYQHKDCPPNTWWKALLRCQKWEKVFCIHVNKENSFISEHYYRQNKSKPFLKRLIGKIKCHTDNLYCPYIGFFYSLGSRNCDM